MRILKFGGSSLATPDRIGRVAEIVRAAAARGEVAVVVSALGGVTNALGEAAAAAKRRDEEVANLVARLEERHLETARAVADATEVTELEARTRRLLGQLLEFLQGIGLVGEASPRSLDRILACGELLSAPLVAAALRRAGLDATDVDARQLIVTNAVHGNARPEAEATRARIQKHFETTAGFSVITGFLGATPDGETTTLGRGGSDFTASIVANAVGASAVELWTDVSGVMSADPRLVTAARQLRRLRYDELMELSHFGAKVVHPPSVHPVRAAGIPLWIKNTFEPEHPGTLVTDELADEPTDGMSPEDRPVRGITSIRGMAMARLEGDGMVGVPGVAMRLFGALARHGVSVILITQASSEHSICFAVAPEDLEAARTAVQAEFEVDRRAGDIDELEVEDDVAVVAVVGAAMREHPGIAGRLFSILGERGINVRAIAQGSSELNISVVVKRDDEARAVQAIHHAFFEEEAPAASLFLAGVGGVGGALLEQLAQEHHIRLDGIGNSRKALVDPRGIEPSTALEQLRAQPEAGDAADPAERPANDLVNAALSSPSTVRVFVDCTAADDMAETYERLLAAGVTVVTANKIPLAGNLERYRALERLAKAGPGALLHEATVGAGLPVVGTLNDLVATGDELVRVEGVFSGTASFLCAELASGASFSDAVAHARNLGYTEPDPREDLAGEDAARKLLILARLAGADIERADLEVEPWIPTEPWAGMAPEEFARRLPELDEGFRSRLESTAENGTRLAYLSTWDRSQARVALAEIGPEHPCFDLLPGENLIAFHTRRYAKMPLVVRGPGAGREVTAAAVFADILRKLETQGNRA